MFFFYVYCPVKFYIVSIYLWIVIRMVLYQNNFILVCKYYYFFYLCLYNDCFDKSRIQIKEKEKEKNFPLYNQIANKIRYF